MLFKKIYNYISNYAVSQEPGLVRKVVFIIILLVTNTIHLLI